MTIFIPILIIILGFMLRVSPPNDINKKFGYRTSFSMKNKETWNEGNRYASTMVIIGGFLSLLFAFLLSHYYKLNNSKVISISSIFMIIVVLGLGYSTEIYLRAKFDKDGNRKTKS